MWTIEAGRIGNEKPLTIVNEVWSSPELGITLESRDVDPVVVKRIQGAGRIRESVTAGPDDAGEALS